jgi:hypothetical protein
MGFVKFDGAPGEVWTNDTGRAQYQWLCDLKNTCGACFQLHMTIASTMPQLHFGCNCRVQLILPGQDAQPFVDFRKLLDAMPEDQKAAAVGVSNYRLIQHKVVSWQDVVTPSRVRDLREVVAREKLSIDTLTGAGVRPQDARRAFEAVHTPVHQLEAQTRQELLERLKSRGVQSAEARKLVAERLAARVSVAAGPSGPQGPLITPGGPKPKPKPTPKAPPKLTPKEVEKIAGVKLKPLPKLKPEPTPKAPVFHVKGTVSKSLQDEVRKAVEAIPSTVLKVLEDQGVKIALAGKMADVLPDAKLKQTPSGWPAGMTWANSDGIFYNAESAAVACETYLDYTLGNEIKSRRVVGVLRHETGHGFDKALGKPSYYDAKFRGGYQVDMLAVPDADRKELAYYLQHGGRGAEEVFAEVFAQLNGGGAFHRSILEYFPRAVKFIQEAMQ